MPKLPRVSGSEAVLTGAVADLCLARFLRCALLLLVLTTVSAVAEKNETWPADAPYNKFFDTSHASMAAEDLAKRGAPDALRTLFLCAYVRVNQPFLGGEGEETMNLIFQRVLAANGDARFARALARQRPEVRSAVRNFLWISPSGKFPRTRKLLREAPEIDWPMAQAYRNDR